MISELTFAALVWGSLLVVLGTFGYLVATMAGFDPLGALGVGR